MIDWLNLATNSLWILGCALALACFSYASWQAWLYKEKLRDRLRLPDIQRPLFIAGILFCAGLAATSKSLVEIVLWGILGVFLILELVFSFRRKGKPARSQD